ncbi:MAG: HAD-IC family P-type ATPase [bacterium]|nr:HAD-IC family P-type ATPase [bacterium]
MWAEQDANEVLYALNTTEDGLTNEEVKKRQEEYGKNILPKAKRTSVLKLIFNQFKSAIMLILFIAIGLSLAIGEYSNVIFIGAVIIINVVLGFIQEFTAQRSSEKLQEQLNIKIEVIRNKEIILLNSEDLVVGDIVLLESGNKIPADIRLIETTNFKVDESILSGESEGREKNCEKGKACSNIIDCTNMVYAGTAVLSGRAKGVVVETGINTEFGKISNKVINMKEAPSPLVIRINKFVKQISLFFAVLVLFLSIVLYVKGYHITDIMFSVIALTVSAIPEGLSTAVTISLSLSSNRMAKKNVIVKNLNSVESLGSCTVIASDKTGTLTVNEQTAKMIVLPDNSKLRVTGEGYSVVGSVEVSRKNVNQQNQVDLIATLGFLNNEAQVKYQQEQYSFIGDSIDIAFKVLGIKNGVQTDDIKVASKIPYESENRYSALEYLQNDKRFVTIKGSPETVIEHCRFMQKDGEKSQ